MEITNQTENKEFDTDIFNVSDEFEDISIVISNLTGEAEMAAAARRC